MTKIYKRDGSDYEPLPIKEFILEEVKNGIKAVELAALVARAQAEDIDIYTETREFEVSRQIPVKKYSQAPFLNVVNDLIGSGDIVELEYVLPHMDYRVKSFYMPRGTNLNVVRLDRDKEQKGDYLV